MRLLITRRRAMGITQQELAERADASPSLISRIENGLETPSVRMLGRLARGLGSSLVVSLDDPAAAGVA